MSENVSPVTARTETQNKRDKRRPLIAFGLAALAVGGIGAAATSAAWTDNVFFSAQAQAATFNLQGSLDATTWAESATDSTIELIVPAEKLANLLPGQTRTIDLSVRNQGSVSAALVGSTTWVGSTFATAPGVTISALPATLAAGSSVTFQLTVTADANWAATNQGKSGTIVVTIAGTATA